MRRTYALTAVLAAAIMITAVGCSAGEGSSGSGVNGSLLTVQSRIINVEGHRVRCAVIDSSRGVGLSCAWPDDLRNPDE